MQSKIDVRIIRAADLALALAAAAAVLAWATNDHDAHAAHVKPTAQADTDMTDGEVRKVARRVAR